MEELLDIADVVVFDRAYLHSNKGVTRIIGP